MLLTTLIFFSVVGIGHIRMLWADGKLFDIKNNLKGHVVLVGL